jgi:signal transduction histidine kinase/DNA-binding response OmpR family regulator
VAERVAAARAIQRAALERRIGLHRCDHQCAVRPRPDRDIAEPDAAATALLRDASEKLGFSARAYHRVLKVARTLADLDGARRVGRIHLAEATLRRNVPLVAAPRRAPSVADHGAPAWTPRAETLRMAAGGGIAAAAASLAAILLVPPFAILFAASAAVGAGAAAWALTALSGRRRAEALARLAAENAELSRALEAAVDRSWELEESEERYRSLVDARERAEAASRAKSRFLATVSHEFRTPLNGILGLNRLLLETGMTPAQETYARGVQSSGTALLTLIEDMLDFSKIEAGRLDIRPEPIDLAVLVAEVAELLSAKAYRKGIDIGVDIDADLPERVVADPARLRQVLVNLVGNAVKFTEAGGITVTVAVERRMAAGRVRLALAVADTGPGIPEADAERLFGEFEQADSALTRRHGGTGLGLAISRRLVAAMGGVLTVAPAPSGGSVFRFAIEAEVVAAAITEVPPVAGLRVLVAMPDGAEAPALTRALAAAGVDARQVATLHAAAALVGAAAAAGLAYDVLLLDGRLAAGGDPVARLREAAGLSLPVVALVAPDRRAEAAGLAASGYAGFVLRPFRRASLLAVVASAAHDPAGFGVDPHDGGKPVAAPALPRQAGTVLLAEDNEISALLARAVFESLGHAVTEVGDGLAAVAAATAEAARYDAIFLDLHMPELDGLAVAARIRAHERANALSRTPVIALTADTLPETRRAALAAGVDLVLEKPVSPDALRAALAGVGEDRAAA